VLFEFPRLLPSLDEGRQRAGNPLQRFRVGQGELETGPAGSRNYDDRHQVFFSQDSQFVGSATGTHAVCVWRVADGREILRAQLDYFRSACLASFSPDASLLAVLTDDNRVCVWGVGERRELWRSHEGVYDQSSLTFSADGERVLCESRNDLLP
jgi:WD40 repeat protein